MTVPEFSFSSNTLLQVIKQCIELVEVSMRHELEPLWFCIKSVSHMLIWWLNVES
jgi:hypothetical protein